MRKVLLSVLLVAVGLFMGCGGSSSSSGGGGGTTVTLQSIAVTPATPSISVGTTQQFTATGSYSDGTTKNLTSTANWLSSTTSVATITTAGLATAVTGGTTTITASSGGVSGGTTLTVVALQSIAVTPSVATVAPLGTQQFMATGNYSDGSTKDLTTIVGWSATNGATISAGGLATAGAIPGAVSIAAAILHNPVVGFATLTVTNPLVSISVTPGTASVAPNGTQQFTATGTYADHSTQNITTSVTWSASVGATITASGLATGVTPNSTSTIMASLGTATPGTATLTVTNPLVSIAVTPPSASIAQTTTQQFTATPTYADGTHLPAITPTWNSSNTAVATISNGAGTQGLASAVAAGTTSITATLGSITSPPAMLTVTSATLVSIAVTPVAQAIVYQTTQQYTAIGTFSDSTTQDISSTATWASSDTTKITLTVSGLATGVGTTSSPVNITATKNSVVGTTTATVIPPQVASIAITPNITQVAQGTTQQYTATATLTNGSSLNVTSLANWSSSNIAIATVGQHTGIVAAANSVSVNTPVTITATYNGQSGTLPLTVTNATANSLTVTPITASVPVGIQLRFTATVAFSDGTTQDVTSNSSWVSSDSTIASVNSGTGLVTARAPGTVTVTATFQTASGSAQFTVTAATLTSIAVSPVQSLLAPGSTLAYQAVGHYSDGSTQFISALATWSSSNPSVVSVTPSTGFATGQSAGTANISAKFQGITSNSAGVVVTPSALASIAVTPSARSIPFGVSQQFTATGTFADQSTQNLTNNVTWASSNPSVATITNSTSGGSQGLALGVSPGQTSITAVFASIISGPATLTVSNAQIQSITLVPSIQGPVSPGTQVIYQAFGQFQGISQGIDISKQVMWSTSNPTVATINTSGQAFAAATGSTTISASFTQGTTMVTGTANLTVQ